jgi:hypothetical protein
LQVTRTALIFGGILDNGRLQKHQPSTATSSSPVNPCFALQAILGSIACEDLDDNEADYTGGEAPTLEVCLCVCAHWFCGGWLAVVKTVLAGRVFLCQGIS